MRRTRTLHRLTARRVEQAKLKGLYADGGSLYLRVAEGGSKQWIFRYTVGGRHRDMSLGPTHTLTLAQARERARACRLQRLDGLDPIEERRTKRAAERAEKAKVITFRECADQYIKAKESEWTNATHRRQWQLSIEQVQPAIGKLDVRAINTQLVVAALQPLFENAPESALRTRGRIEAVLDWATVREFRTGDNPARWGGHLEHVFPKRGAVEHHAAMDYREIGAFMAKVRAHDSVQARALEFLILTAARRGEVLEASWDEIDLVERAWTIPGSRMKTGKPHRVPLSDEAMKVIERMRAIRHSDYIFPGRIDGKPLGATSLVRLMDELGTNATIHGFRSSFRTWAAERTTFPREIAELALAHTVSSEVERAYQRSDLFERRRQCAAAWVKFCANGDGNGAVIPITARR